MSADIQTIRHLQQENIRLRSENSAMQGHVMRLQRAFGALIKLQRALSNITAKTDVFRLIHQILATALDAVDSEDGSLLLLDDETGDLVFVEVIGQAHAKLKNMRMAKGQGVAGWVVAHRAAKLVEDARREPLFSPQMDKVTGMSTTSLICVPLLDGPRPLGAIEVVNTRSGQPFAESDTEILLLVGQLAAMAIIVAEKSYPQTSP